LRMSLAAPRMTRAGGNEDFAGNTMSCADAHHTQAANRVTRAAGTEPLADRNERFNLFGVRRVGSVHTRAARGICFAGFPMSRAVRAMSHAGKMVTQAVRPERHADEGMCLAAARDTQAASTIAHGGSHARHSAHHMSQNTLHANRSTMSGTPYAFAPLPSDRRSGDAPVQSHILLPRGARPPLAEG
jgi:hypothetical protein